MTTKIIKTHFPEMPIWPVVEFVMMLGADVLETIDASTDKNLKFYKFLLARTDTIDMRKSDNLIMVQDLMARGIIDLPKFNELKGGENT